MFLNERNIITAKSFKKLNDKMLNSFINLDLINSSYKLKLSKFIHVHDVFHSDLLRSVVDNFLSDQKNEFSDSIVINCYDSSYASMLIAMLMTMLMTMFLTIVDRSSLDYRVVLKSILFRVSLCSSESYR